MERDDLIVNDSYALNSHHDEEKGKKIRKKIWMVTLLLTVVTAVEVVVGVMWTKPELGVDSSAWMGIKVGYILLTLVKAGYIVAVFMHLGDERKNLRMAILVPYIIFIVYLLFIAIKESGYVEEVWKAFS